MFLERALAIRLDEEPGAHASQIRDANDVKYPRKLL